MRRAASGRWFIASIILISLVALASQAAFAQSLGEVARKQQQRRTQASNLATHVYTNEDLKRPEILLPQDRGRFEANRVQPKPQSAAAPQTAAAPPDLGKPADLPLGDVARYCRELQRLRVEQQLARDKVLPGASGVASPKFTAPVTIPALHPERRPAAPPRRDPFAPYARHEIPAPVAAEGVRVQRGDSLWNLAARYLGDGAKWRQILAVNPELSDPNLIRVGQTIQLPEKDESQVAALHTQRVERGDSLWKLAKVHLGSRLAWSCIAQANPQITNVDRIYPGQVLNLPAACGPVAQITTVQRASN